MNAPVFKLKKLNKKTQIFDLRIPEDSQSPDTITSDPETLTDWQLAQIQTASKLLSQGKTVAFPTETVYGLGANALDEGAVKNIFEAKGRPSDNPLIVHVAEFNDLNALVDRVPEKAGLLMKVFWPGSLSIILKRKPIVPDIVTAGLDTVAVRMPENPEARLLIRHAKCPIAAPSANLSGKPSPTRPEHVLRDLMGRVDGIVLGRNCNVGLESTVIDLTVDPPVILRPGIVTKQEIESVIGSVRLSGETAPPLKDHIRKANPSAQSDMLSETPKAPGMKYTHYAPNAPIFLYEGTLPFQKEQIVKKAKKSLQKSEKVGIIASDETQSLYENELQQGRLEAHLVSIHSVGSRAQPQTIANMLFDLLRTFDDENVDLILSESFEPDGVGYAVMNRLKKASKIMIDCNHCNLDKDSL